VENSFYRPANLLTSFISGFSTSKVSSLNLSNGKEIYEEILMRTGFGVLRISGFMELWIFFEPMILKKKIFPRIFFTKT